MARAMGIILVVVASVVLFSDSALAGAKGGKIRWSSNNNITNGKPAIKVPAATADKPGVWETKIVFKANELAEFSVIGDGDTDLDLYIYDIAGQLVVKDADPPAAQGGGSDICRCQWTPRIEQEFTIRILNFGPRFITWLRPEDATDRNNSFSAEPDIHAGQSVRGWPGFGLPGRRRCK